MVVLNTLFSVLLVSSVSVAGILFLALRQDKLKKLQLILVGFATGGLLGGAFFHLLPESFEAFENAPTASILIVLGFILFFILERFLHWHHNHTSGLEERSIKPFGTINLVADMFHNLLDGILIAASYSYSTEIGLATTVTVLIHEIPQEIGDFGVLIHAGFSRKKALLFNFLSACTAFVGAGIVLVLKNELTGLTNFILPVAAGGFIYLAAADLIPELHSEKTFIRSVYQFIALITGILLLFVMVLFTE